MLARIVLGAFLFFAASFSFASAGRLTFVSDTIANSAPNATTTHTFQFTVTNAIPASGTIVISSPEGALNIPAGMDFTDVDIAIATSSGFVDRDVAAAASATDDGVSMTAGSTGSFTITLNSSEGIDAGADVQIQVGTHATHGTAGDELISNPGSTGSYRIRLRTTTAGSVTIDEGTAMIAVIQGVGVSAYPPPIPPSRSDGLPSGELAPGNDTIELSLRTDEQATCRYSTTAGTPYASMTESFSSAGHVLHYVNVSGHVDDTSYVYYVRCSDFGGQVNTDDYEIAFSLDEEATSGVGGSDGTGGVGPIFGGSSVLFQSSVVVSGWTSPQSTVYILRDGKQVATAQVGQNGSFTTTIGGMERGTYSFGTYAEDRARRKSSAFTSTLTIGQGTNNTISGVLIPPTIALESDTVDVGDSVTVLGTGIPGSTIEVILAADSGGLGSAIKVTATTTKGVSNVEDGNWSVTIPGNRFSRDTYQVKARLVTDTGAQSSYSTIAFLGVGEEPSPDLSNRSDINKDGKVNLVDFSILLSNWNTDDADSDINLDGIVNLSDVSIMLFNWTG